jgi:hypothetical protein
MNGEIVAAIVAGVFSVCAILAGRIIEKERAYAASLRERKIQAYEGLLEFVFGAMFSPSYEPSEGQSLPDFTKELITWGSDDVLTRYTVWRHRLSEDGAQGALDSLSKLIRAIRDDLGHKGVAEGVLPTLISVELHYTSRSMEGKLDDAEPNTANAADARTSRG